MEARKKHLSNYDNGFIGGMTKSLCLITGKGSFDKWTVRLFALNNVSGYEKVKNVEEKLFIFVHQRTTAWLDSAPLKACGTI